MYGRERHDRCPLFSRFVREGGDFAFLAEMIALTRVAHFSRALCARRGAFARNPFALTLHAVASCSTIKLTRVHVPSSKPKSMQRLTAKFLLLFALVGTVVPIAMAVTAPQHACCVRKTHHCHESASPDSTQLAISSKTCDHDCCRAVSTSQWANPQLGISPAVVQNVATHTADSQPRTPTAQHSASQSTRAPPQLSIA